VILSLRLCIIHSQQGEFVTEDTTERISPRYLIITAFCSGMTIMAIEMAASRLMAPYFGTSVFVWTNLLGIIMTALSIGYWLGGRLADRHPTREFLYGLLFVSAVMLLCLPFIAPWIMDWVSRGVKEGEVSLVVYSFISSLIIFCIPFSVLGMVSPTIIRLLSHAVEESGRVAGKVYAASTVGSIVGTFLPTLVFVPWIGTKKTIILFAIILLVISIVGLGRKLLCLTAVPFMGSFILIPAHYFSTPDVLFQTESPYTYIKVTEDPYFGIMLQQDEGFAMHSFYNPDQVLTGSYWDYLLPAPYFQKDKQEQQITVIGAAGGTAYRIWEETLGDDFDFRFTGAEIDPVVVRLAHEYFGMSEYDNVEISAQDGRIFLKNQPDGRFDVIFLDAYHQIYMPPHLTSLEFFQLTEQKLNPDGVFVANVNALFEDSDIYLRLIRTLQEVYDKVWVVKAGEHNFNYVFFASNSDTSLEEAIAAVPNDHALLRARMADSIRLIGDLSDIALVTDDRPLTEVLFDRTIGEWLFQGRKSWGNYLQ